MLQVGKNESVEQAVAKFLCTSLNLPDKRKAKVVIVEIPSTDPGRPPIKTTAMKECYDEPIQSLLDVIEPALNEEQDIATRMGYVKGYETKNANMQTAQIQALLPTLVNENFKTKKTAEFTGKIFALLTAKVTGDLTVVKEVVADALYMKGSQGYLNGFWQGQSDCGKGIMPQFQSPEEVTELRY